MNLPVDWKAFEYKFSADPRAAFESLAYILFCYELKQDCGIFRYYNQPYIETQPVDTADGHKVGFQAKYYDARTTVASREQELKAAIEGVKKNFDKEDIEENRAFFAEDRYAYTRWLADYVLDLPSDKQKKLIQNIMPCVSMEDTFVHWIWEIVACEMEKSRHIAFWNVWDLLQPYIFRRCDEQRVLEESTDTKYFKSTQEFEELIKNYLLAGIPWAEKMTFWDSLKPEKANFYRKAAIRIGYHPVVLYSISYILNSIGKDTFSKEGVEWLSMIMKNNPHLKKAELPVNTQYFIEEYMNTRIKKEKFTLRTNEHRRKQVMIILDFLVERGSTVGFGMREEVI